MLLGTSYGVAGYVCLKIIQFHLHICSIPFNHTISLRHSFQRNPAALYLDRNTVQYHTILFFLLWFVRDAFDRHMMPLRPDESDLAWINLD